jgi:hypothetical protein
MHLKKINVFEECAKSILSYIENTPIEIKLSLSRQNFAQNQQNFRSKITSPNMMEWSKKPYHATAPLKNVARIFVLGC